MMYPVFLECTECGDKLKFPKADRSYYLGSDIPKAVPDDKILNMLLKPCWCFDCNSPSWIEDIPEIDVIESQCIAVKSGKEIEYPVCNRLRDADETLSLLNQYMELRIKRGSQRHCIICYGTNYVVLDGNPVRLRHEHCDYGVYKPVYNISSYNAPMQSQVYDLNGRLIGSLYHWVEELNGWGFSPAKDSKST